MADQSLHCGTDVRQRLQKPYPSNTVKLHQLSDSITAGYTTTSPCLCSRTFIFDTHVSSFKFTHFYENNRAIAQGHVIDEKIKCIDRM